MLHKTQPCKRTEFPDFSSALLWNTAPQSANLMFLYMDGLQMTLFPVAASSVKLPWFPAPAHLPPLGCWKLSCEPRSAPRNRYTKCCSEGCDPSAKGVAAPKRLLWFPASPVPGRNKMGGSKKEAFFRTAGFIGKKRVLSVEIREMSHTESPVPSFWVPQQLPCYVAFMCKLLLG